MSNWNLEQEEVSIVLLGSFNPEIYHPSWFEKHKLLAEDDIKEAKVELIHNEIARFTLNWVLIEVTHQRFMALTTDPSRTEQLRDLVVSVFHYLSHTPIKQLGMNRKLFYCIDDEERWHKVGDALAPKDVWNKSLPERVGMKSLMVQSPRDDDLDGKINVTVRPTEALKALFDVNSHIELNNEERSVPEIITEYWHGVQYKAENIATKTLTEILG